VLQKVVSEVWANTSQVSSGSALPQEKEKFAYKLLGVSSRITLSTLSDRVVCT